MSKYISFLWKEICFYDPESDEILVMTHGIWLNRALLGDDKNWIYLGDL